MWHHERTLLLAKIHCTFSVYLLNTCYLLRRKVKESEWPGKEYVRLDGDNIMLRKESRNNKNKNNCNEAIPNLTWKWDIHYLLWQRVHACVKFIYMFKNHQTSHDWLGVKYPIWSDSFTNFSLRNVQYFNRNHQQQNQLKMYCLLRGKIMF